MRLAFIYIWFKRDEYKYTQEIVLEFQK